MENLDELASRVIEIFREKGLSLALAEFREKGLSLALAESCTGGMIAETITNVAGASDIFYGSAVTYVNSAKEHILGVARETLEKHGAVSSECAEEMACGARRVYGADVAMSVTETAPPCAARPSKKSCAASPKPERGCNGRLNPSARGTSPAHLRLRKTSAAPHSGARRVD